MFEDSLVCNAVSLIHYWTGIGDQNRKTNIFVPVKQAKKNKQTKKKHASRQVGGTGDNPLRVCVAVFSLASSGLPQWAENWVTENTEKDIVNGVALLLFPADQETYISWKYPEPSRKQSFAQFCPKVWLE